MVEHRVGAQFAGQGLCGGSTLAREFLRRDCDADDVCRELRLEFPVALIFENVALSNDVGWLFDGKKTLPLLL